MDKKTRILLNGEFNLTPTNPGIPLKNTVQPTDTFTEWWAASVRAFSNQDEIVADDASTPVSGIVLGVIKNGKLYPEGPRSRINVISSVPTETCLQLYVHVPGVDSLPLPANFVNPNGHDLRLIYEHPIYEAQNDEIDKIVPQMGDIVQVIHARAFDWKAGLYLGKIAPATPLTVEKASANFKNVNKRNKSVPAE